MVEVTARLYKVILADGTELTDVYKNGTYFYSLTPVHREVFDLNLDPVTIEVVPTKMMVPEEQEYLYQYDQPIEASSTTYDHMRLVYWRHRYEDKDQPEQWWFGLETVPDMEVKVETLRSDVEYIAMMTDVEL